MPPNIPPDLLPRARQIILPLVGSEDEREALLTDAFYTLPDSRLYHQIKRDGTPMSFTTLCLKKLIDYGCVTHDTHALGQLLDVARMYCGVDKHAEIEQLIHLSKSLCVEDQVIAVVAPAPSAVATKPQNINTPLDERSATVFVSYSHKDAEIAERLIADLQRAGHACWIDTVRIKGGDEWIQSITEGINNSYAFISLVSLDSNESTWVRREFLWAEHKKKSIIPVMVRPCELTIYLMERQVINLHGTYDTGLKELLDVLPSPQLATRVVESEGVVEAIEPVDAILRKRPVNRRRLEKDYLDQLQAEVLFDLEKYTPLGGESQFIVQIQRGKPLELAHMRPEFEHLQRSHDRQTETRHFDNAVDEILSIRRAAVLGEPGAGKTTTLLSLAGQLAQKAQSDPKSPVPIFVRLGRWTDANQSLEAFIAQEMGALGAYLRDLIAEDRAVPLLDGMNEIPVSQRQTKYKAIQQWIMQYPDWLAVTSCREQDYTIELEFDRITIKPLDALRVREFVVRYLGQEKGESLFWKLAGDSALEVWAKWEQAGASFDLFWTAKDIPRENPNVYGVTSGQDDQIWREHIHNTTGLMSLAYNPYMLSMLTQVYVDRDDLPPNRGELFRDFVTTLLVREGIVKRDATTKQVVMTDEAYELQFALAELAYEMQIQRGQSDDGNALTVLPMETVHQFLTERQLYQSGSTSILDVGEGVRFSHQLLQEYFAAIALSGRIFGNSLLGRAYRFGDTMRASDIWQMPNWWERTNWEEAVILLAGLYSDDCTQVLLWVNEANPEVASMCMARSGASVPDATREKLRQAWLARLTDEAREPQPKARAAIGRALGLVDLDNRKGVNVIVRDGVKLPDIDWVTIPRGEFSYQDGTKTLDYDYQIARYPVTYVQFQTFLDDSEGATDNRWWDGLPNESKPLIGDAYPTMQIAEQGFKYWNHPREMVNWYQAIAFCRWFSWRLGGEYALDAVEQWAVRLPTEFEWEKAARAMTGWEYPYGAEFDAMKGNIDETGIGQTSAVGIFPSGDTPHWDKPISDLSGNVWEWCLTDYENPQMKAVDENMRSDNRRVLRAGSWYRINYGARAVYRNTSNPSNRNFNFGFRLFCRPPSS